jgi:hypothetical protein
VLGVLLAGFGLRAYQLGHDSFWNDEAAHALAAIQPTLRGTVAVCREHTMAMPLDYLVVRAATRLGTSEGVMRLPSLLWGTLALAVFFALARRLTDFRTAAVASLLLALSVPHVRYSQELRFYAALQCLYLLATWLLFRALADGRVRSWVAFGLTLSVGSYFHPYVLLAAVNGFAAVALSTSPPSERRRSLLGLAACALVGAVLFLPGYAYFGEHQPQHHELLIGDPSVAAVIARGFGWMAFQYSPLDPAFGVWPALGVVFAGAGLARTVLDRKRRDLLALTAGAVLQVGVILAADVAKGFWFLPRQLVHLAPAALLLSGVGVASLSEAAGRWVVRHRGGSGAPARRAVLAAVLLAFALAAVPPLRRYYDHPKSSGRAVAARVVRERRPGEPILVIPGHEEKILRFYLIQTGNTRLRGALARSEWRTLADQITHRNHRVFLMARSEEAETQGPLLDRLGFRRVLGDEPARGGVHWLLAADPRQ